MQSLPSQYKELEGKTIHHSDAAFHEDSEKNGSNGLNRMRLTDNKKRCFLRHMFGVTTQRKLVPASSQAGAE